MIQVCRELDEFVQSVTEHNVTNKNVELQGKNGFKLFHNGISHIIRNGISVDGPFHISMARHLHVYLCNLEILPITIKERFGTAYDLLSQVHNNLRMPVKKQSIKDYQHTIDRLMVMIKMLCAMPAFFENK
jgi:hypothetical protein